jgi:hypothetical protein
MEAARGLEVGYGILIIMASAFKDGVKVRDGK